jgi:hypothetical protein
LPTQKLVSQIAGRFEKNTKEKAADGAIYLEVNVEGIDTWVTGVDSSTGV